jgi:hypothetical protein
MEGGMNMATYRVMCKQETGEDYCVASGLTRAQARKRLVEAQEQYAEFYGFNIEREIDYYAQARRAHNEGYDDHRTVKDPKHFDAAIDAILHRSTK